MAISYELNAQSRTDRGKGASRRLRHAGKIPAIIYGGGKDPVSLTLSHNEVLRNLENEAFTRISSASRSMARKRGPFCVICSVIPAVTWSCTWTCNASAKTRS